MRLMLLPFIVISLVVAQQPASKNPAIENILKEISADSIKATVQKLASFGTRHTLSDTVSATRGIGAARRWIKSEFERYAMKSGGRLTVSFHETLVPPSGRVPTPTNVVNVVATLNQAHTQHMMPDRYLLVGGHYDSRASDGMDAQSDAPGANDDGSGTALVLELARVFSTYEFNAAIVFVAFAAEEQGLYGAGALAEKAKSEHWNIEAVFNNDIVGNSMGGDGIRKNDYVRLFSEAFSPVDTGAAFRRTISLGHENDGGSRSLSRYIKEIAERYNPTFGVKMVYRLDRFSRGGDHRPFHQLGFPAVRFSVATENYDWQHQNVRTENGTEYGDLVKFMDFEYCANVVRANAAALASLALAPAPPGNVQIISALGYETHLRWNRNIEPDMAGYLVRYRETTSPVWQYEMFTSDTTISLKATKDEYLFGVQAVDRDGNASLFSLPRAVGR